MDCKHGSGKMQHKTRIAQNIDSVKDGIKWNNARGTHKSIRQIQETGIPKTSEHRIEADVL